MVISQKQNCNRCRAVEAGGCALGYPCKENIPAAPCPKPLTLKELEAAELFRAVEANKPEQEAVGEYQKESMSPAGSFQPKTNNQESTLSKDSVHIGIHKDSEKSACYLVDTENIGKLFIPMLTDPEPETDYLLFCTENSPTVPLSVLPKVAKNIDKLQFVECFVPGPNALDFQLVSYLGYLLNTNPEKKYIIVSKDTGYDPVVKFWKAKGFKVSRQIPKAQAEAPKLIKNDPESESPAQPATIQVKQEDLTIHNGLDTDGEDESVSKKMVEISSKNKKKQTIYSKFCSTFGQEKGTRLYQKNKKFIYSICDKK